MNFFQQLSEMGNVNITISIKQKNDKFTLSILPGISSASITPIIVTGTPAELDAEFFTAIAPGINEVAGIISNLEDVKKEALGNKETKKAEPVKATAKKEASKPAKAVAKKNSKPAMVEASIFDTTAALPEVDNVEVEGENNEEDNETETT